MDKREARKRIRVLEESLAFWSGVADRRPGSMIGRYCRCTSAAHRLRGFPRRLSSPAGSVGRVRVALAAATRSSTGRRGTTATSVIGKFAGVPHVLGRMLPSRRGAKTRVPTGSIHMDKLTIDTLAENIRQLVARAEILRTQQIELDQLLARLTMRLTELEVQRGTGANEEQDQPPPPT